MKRNKIIKHYKSFFGLEDMGLAENDHLMIDWAESLIKDCNMPVVVGRSEQYCDCQEIIVADFIDKKHCSQCNKPMDSL